MIGDEIQDRRWEILIVSVSAPRSGGLASWLARAPFMKSSEDGGADLTMARFQEPKSTLTPILAPLLLHLSPSVLKVMNHRSKTQKPKAKSQRLKKAKNLWGMRMHCSQLVSIKPPVFCNISNFQFSSFVLFMQSIIEETTYIYVLHVCRWWTQAKRQAVLGCPHRRFTGFIDAGLSFGFWTCMQQRTS